MDTPLTDPTVVHALLKCVVETKHSKRPEDMEERFYRTEIFLNYLEQMEKKELESRAEFKDSDLTRIEFMPEIIASYEKIKDYIIRKRHSTCP
jgi:hypothetical protein